MNCIIKRSEQNKGLTFLLYLTGGEQILNLKFIKKGKDLGKGLSNLFEKTWGLREII